MLVFVKEDQLVVLVDKEEFYVLVLVVTVNEVGGMLHLSQYGSIVISIIQLILVLKVVVSGSGFC